MNENRLKLAAAALLISLLATCAVLLGRVQGLLEPLELMSYDLMLSARPDPAQPPRVTLVAVTEADIAEQGRWPLSDATLAAALEALAGLEPRAIGLDIYRDLPVPPGTDRLDAVLTGIPSIVGIFKFHTAGSEGVAAPAVLARTDRAGFSDIVLDDGATARRGLAFLDDGTTFATSFALKLALGFLREEGIGLAPDEGHPEHFRLGATTVPPLGRNFGGYFDLDAAGYQFMIDYSRGSDAFPRYRFADLVNGQVPREHVVDRIVILGVDAQSVKDSFATPIGQWPWAPDPSMPGIALHAHMTDQLVRTALDGAQPMSSWPWAAESALILFGCFAGALVGLVSRSAPRLVIIGSLGAGLIFAASFLAFLTSLWIPGVPVAIGWAFTLALVTGFLLQKTGRDRAALQRLLSLHVSPAVAAAVWERRDELLREGALRPQRVTATVMFMDLQGFTRLSESLQPEALMAWLTPIMDAATSVVLAHHGMLDDYFGDGVKANFGLPLGPADDAGVTRDARRAVRCALALAEAAARSSDGAVHPYVIRVGIHTGPVLAGSVGGRERLKYTSIGDAVNIAARLEALAKETPASGGPGSRILISAETAHRVAEEFELHALGSVVLRGKEKLTGVFEVIGHRAQATAAAGEQVQSC